MTRILPPVEWARLKGTEAETIWPLLEPTRSHVVVVERDGVIVGCHILAWVLHAECLWIAPDDRGKGSVARRLWKRVCDLTRLLGSPTLVTAAVDDRVRGLLAHVGATQIPGDQFVIPMKGRA